MKFNKSDGYSSIDIHIGCERQGWRMEKPPWQFDSLQGYMGHWNPGLIFEINLIF